MGNPWEGEVAIRFGGARHVMKLTLGALASLEHDLKAGSLVELAVRFESGSFRAADVLAVLEAGLRGAGSAPDESDLSAAQIEGGPMAAARAAAQLLARAFMPPETG